MNFRGNWFVWVPGRECPAGWRLDWSKCFGNSGIPLPPKPCYRSSFKLDDWESYWSSVGTVPGVSSQFSRVETWVIHPLCSLPSGSLPCLAFHPTKSQPGRGSQPTGIMQSTNIQIQIQKEVQIQIQIQSQAEAANRPSSCRARLVRQRQVIRIASLAHDDSLIVTTNFGLVRQIATKRTCFRDTAGGHFEMHENRGRTDYKTMLQDSQSGAAEFSAKSHHSPSPFQTKATVECTFCGRPYIWDGKNMQWLQTRLCYFFLGCAKHWARSTVL